MKNVPVTVSPVPVFRLTMSPEAAEIALSDPLSTRTEAAPGANVTVSFDPTTSAWEFVSTPTVTPAPLTTSNGASSPLPPTVTPVPLEALTVKNVPAIVSPVPDFRLTMSPEAAEIALFDPLSTSTEAAPGTDRAPCPSSRPRRRENSSRPRP